MDVKKRVEELQEEMISQLGRLVKYDSKRGEALPGKPFGEGPAAVLAEALQLAEEMGFETKNLDNYCGYAQIGEGKDIIGIAAHLDIVPAGEGWSTDPFTLTRKGDVLYGRGVSDDKGAVIASLYALKVLQEEGIALNKRIRVIMGCAEETGSPCMVHYGQVEEPVTVGFTPDAEFPGIYGEKGMMALLVKSKNTKIIDIYNELKEYGITATIADPAADADEAKRLYGIEFVDMNTIKDCDAVILAVAHEQFKSLTMADFDRMFKAGDNSKKVLVDIKGLLDRKEYEAAGYNYWRL